MVHLSVIAENEKEAMLKSSNIIKREEYIITSVFEIYEKNSGEGYTGEDNEKDT